MMPSDSAPRTTIVPSGNTGTPHASTRRQFIAGTLAGAVGLHVVDRAFAAPAPVAGFEPSPGAQEGGAGPEGYGRRVVETTDFAQVVELADRVWAIVSARGPRTTVCNGGIIAGDNDTLVVEGFNSIGGASWASELAKKLTGRYPKFTVITHLHGDHSSGLAGYVRGEERPQIVSTRKTRQMMAERAAEAGPATQRQGGLAMVGEPQLLPDVVMMESRGTETIDLGGRVVKLVDRIGHTPSDLTVELDDPRVVFSGDLIFNRVFPYYGDALPIELRQTVAGLLNDGDALFVPGHGPLARAADLTDYLGLLESVEQHARQALAEGKNAADMAAEYKVPESLGEWYIWSPQVFRFAFAAWKRALEGGEDE